MTQGLSIRKTRDSRLSDKAPPQSSRLWREWCFLRVVFVRFRIRMLVLVLILFIGGSLFMLLEPEKGHSLPRSIYFAWSLVLGEPPEAFPKSLVLQSLFFLMPILGLTVIIEAIVRLAYVLRDRQEYERSWCSMMASSMSNHIVLVGLGKLGYRTYRMLRRLDEQVVIIERNPANRFLDIARREGTPLLVGDARHEALLEDANIKRAKSVILATDDDLVNLATASDARRLAPKIRVVLRMFDQDMADNIREGFKIHIAMSQSDRSAPAFATAAIDASIINSFVVDDRLIIMQRWRVRQDGPLCDRTVADLMTECGFVVIKHRAKDEMVTMFPPPDTRLQDGDRLVVQGPFDTLSQLRKTAPELQEASR